MWVAKNQIPLFMLDYDGTLLSSTLPKQPIKSDIRLAQYGAVNDPKRKFAISHALVKAKITRSLEVLDWLGERYDIQREVRVTKAEAVKLGNTSTVSQLRTVEGRVALRYWETIRKILPEHLDFRTRSTTSHQNNASDCVNVSLNFSYSILESEVRKSINAVGLEPSIGFLHEFSATQTKESLIYDLQEPFRFLCDLCVIESDNRAGRGQVYLLLDGSDPIVAGVVAPSLDAIAESFSPGPRLNVTDIVLFSPDLRYFEFLVPSLLGLVVQFFPTFLVMFSLTGEKSRGTIEQLVVTPIEGFEILLGKMIAYVIVGLVDAFLALGVAVVLFGMPIRGSVALVVLFMLVFIIASVSLGTLSSVFASNQIEGFLQMIPIVILSVFLSGLIYPLESMSSWLVPVSYIIPQTYMNDALRSLITKGAGLEVVTGDLAALGLYGCVVTALATAFFRKRLG